MADWQELKCKSRTSGTVSNVAIYPIGAMVRLNNQSVGIVHDYADELRTKPIVNITANAAGERVNQMLTIDMEINPALYIAEVF